MIFTTESCLREERAGGAGVEPGHAVHADDVQLRVLGHGEPREGEEPLGQGRQLLVAGTPEVAERGGGVAARVLHEEVGPVAGVDTVVIRQTQLAVHLRGGQTIDCKISKCVGISYFIVTTIYLFRDSISTLGVGCEAALSAGEDPELVLAAGAGDGRVLGRPRAALRLPVVAAVVVRGAGQRALLVKQQPVAAGLEGEGAVGALVELVAAVLLGVELQPLQLGARDVRDELAGGRGAALGRGRRQGGGGLHGHCGGGGQVMDSAGAGPRPYNLPTPPAEILLLQSN